MNHLIANWAFVDGRTWVRDVTLLIEGHLIADVLVGRPAPMDSRPLLAERVPVLLPGFINLHGHLEYTPLRGRLPRGPVPFVEWIDAIRKAKAALTKEDVAAGLAEGFAELVRGGTTTVADSVSLSATVEVLEGGFRPPLNVLALGEVLGLDAKVAQHTSAIARRLEAWAGRQAGVPFVRFGLNPHAPFSAGREARAVVREFLAAGPGALGWHLAETPEEMELLRTGSGPLHDYFAGAGLAMPFDTPPGTGPLQFLAAEGCLPERPRTLAFHGNFLDSAADRELLNRVVLVHCPLTHEFFARPPVNIRTFLEAGGAVALATDGLASADTLSMLDVLRSAARQHPQLAPTLLIGMTTAVPGRYLAEVLPGSPARGVIAPGAAADLTALRIPVASAAAPLADLLLHAESSVAATIVGGILVYSDATEP